MMCFRKFPVAIRLWEGGCEGVSRVSVESFLSHGAKNLVGEPFCAVFQNFSGSGKKMDKTEGIIDILRRKFFVSQCRKNS